METSMTEPAEGEFDLASLNDEELTEQVHDDLYNGLKTEVEEATRIFLKRGWSAERVLNDALVEGMRIVGIDFRDGILFVPEVLLAANSMKGGMEILRPLLAETGVEPIGKIVIDTVKERGIRNDYIVLVGGAPLNEEFGKAVGADAYCRDAAVAVETAKGLIAARRAGAAAH